MDMSEVRGQGARYEAMAAPKVEKKTTRAIVVGEKSVVELWRISWAEGGVGGGGEGRLGKCCHADAVTGKLSTRRDRGHSVCIAAFDLHRRMLSC